MQTKLTTQTKCLIFLGLLPLSSAIMADESKAYVQFNSGVAFASS
jgi:hypothetical protein